VNGEVQNMLKENRYDKQTKTLAFTQAEVDSFKTRSASGPYTSPSLLSMPGCPRSLSRTVKSCAS